ncbi:MAG: C40 family peptidase [Acidobacteria bacterium]|nr:C40 family peptidase [Acidobacteriota bacterium]
MRGSTKPRPGATLAAFGLAALAALSAACASSGAKGSVPVPKPFPMPGGTTTAPPSEPTPAPAPSSAPTPDSRRAAGKTAVDGYALAGTALSLRGAPYRNGGSDPKGFDCSGFIQYVFSRYNLFVPREVRDLYKMGKSLKPDQLTAGDLVFFTTTEPGASHVGMAIGGDQFVHAPSTTGVVRVEHLSASYWSQRFLGARRLN